MIQLKKYSTLTDLTKVELQSLQEEWQEKKAIVLPKLIEPNLLTLIRTAISRGKFIERKHEGVDATEFTLKRDSTIHLLEMLASDPHLTKIISQITGTQPIGYFHGRVYKMTKADHDDWHQDTGADYLMAMSVNLGEKPYQGGSLSLRDANSKKLFCNIKNTGPGDALLFKISKKLEHKIARMTGSNPKIAFAGWYCPKPNFQNYMSRILYKIKKESTMIVSPEKLEANVNAAKMKQRKISETVAFRFIGNKVLLVDLKDDSQCVFNGMGARIWKGICNNEPSEKTFQSLQKTYSLSLSAVKKEYDALVEDLVHVGYLD